MTEGQKDRSLPLSEDEQLHESHPENFPFTSDSPQVPHVPRKRQRCPKEVWVCQLAIREGQANSDGEDVTTTLTIERSQASKGDSVSGGSFSLEGGSELV